MRSIIVFPMLKTVAVIVFLACACLARGDDFTLKLQPDFSLPKPDQKIDLLKLDTRPRIPDDPGRPVRINRFQNRRSPILLGWILPSPVKLGISGLRVDRHRG